MPVPATLAELGSGIVASAGNAVQAPPSRHPIPEALRVNLRKQCLSIPGFAPKAGK